MPAPKTKAPTKKATQKKPVPAKRRGPQSLPNGQPTAKQRLDAIGEAMILEAIASGVSRRDLSTRYGVSTTQLVEWLDENPERLRLHARAREEAAESYDDKALKTLEEADRENIAVAREIAAHYRWRAKAANPKRYSDKLQVDAKVEEAPKSDADIVAALAKFGIVAKLVDPGA